MTYLNWTHLLRTSAALGAAFTMSLTFGSGCSAGRTGGGEGGENGGLNACVGDDCFTLPVDCEDGAATITIKSGTRGGSADDVRDLIRDPNLPPVFDTTPETEGSTDPNDPNYDPCIQELDWTTPAEEPKWTPPLEETFECPDGYVRVNVQDTALPTSLILIDDKWNNIALRQISEGCDWYTTCLPRAELGSYILSPVEGCPDQANQAGTVDFTAIAGSAEFNDIEEIWAADNNDSYTPTADKASVEALLCPPGGPPVAIPDGMIKLHIRYPWGDPETTGFPGSACEDEMEGLSTPPYPTTLRVVHGGCAAGDVASLEFQNGHCPWYSMLIPESSFTGDLSFAYPSHTTSLFSPNVAVPERTDGVNEYWLAYNGPPDDEGMFGTPCVDRSMRANVYHFFTSNPGPGYEGCGGGGDVVLDPCSPPVPDGYSTIHFRYMWAGQKTFTYFPKPEFMPEWMVLEVNGGGGDKDVICYREEDRPWFNCPVPNNEFFEGSEWRAVDKTHAPEWNTVAPHPFPSTPGEYWIRWNYGKPDIPGTVKYGTYDYYPDGSHGDWSATGDWGDDDCAPKPPAEPVVVGYGGWFPYDETAYAYPFGASLAKTFPDPENVQDLLDAFQQERYEIWKANYLRQGADEACAADAARVHTEPPETVSEGQGYGMAIAAAMGDKETFDQLWNFVRHFLSQDNTKYCGGLMGWQWKGPENCRPRDVPCNPDTEGCGGDKDSAFDGDVDIAIGLVYAARQWPEYVSAATNWLIKMECMIDTVHDGTWYYATPGDTWNKNCGSYEPGGGPENACTYTENNAGGRVNLGYYPPGYFRVFGDFLQTYLDPRYWPDSAREYHHDFWYRTAETVYEMFERCYDSSAVNPALVTDWGEYDHPCSSNSDNYNWARYLWRVSVDAAWFGNRTDLPETQPDSSEHYAPKSRMQAKIDNIQSFFTNFHIKNPVVENANRFSTICEQLSPDGEVSSCDPAFGHNSYFVNTALSAYVPVFDNGGETTPAIRQEALEEAVTATVFNDKYYQESLGVYTMLFISGNFPNPMDVQ